jgi:hypothetical protein
MPAKKAVQISTYMVLLSAVLSSSLSAKVWIDDHTLYYTGEITPGQNESLFKLFQQASAKPKRLSIQSGGGNVDAGMDLADFVIANQLDVIVDKFCFSSCANYVFMAGRHKFIQPAAVLGWHGNAASAKWLDQDIDDLLPQLKGDRSAVQWRQLRQHYDQVIKQASARETKLYQQLGIDPSILTLGFSPAIKKAARQQKARGWTLSIPLLTAKGVKNIRTTEQQWQPRSPQNFPLLVLQQF